jgi:hypothetical protein
MGNLYDVRELVDVLPTPANHIAWYMWQGAEWVELILLGKVKEYANQTALEADLPIAVGDVRRVTGGPIQEYNGSEWVELLLLGKVKEYVDQAALEADTPLAVGDVRRVTGGPIQEFDGTYWVELLLTGKVKDYADLPTLEADNPQVDGDVRRVGAQLYQRTSGTWIALSTPRRLKKNTVPEIFALSGVLDDEVDLETTGGVLCGVFRHDGFGWQALWLDWAILCAAGEFAAMFAGLIEDNGVDNLLSEGADHLLLTPARAYANYDWTAIKVSNSTRTLANARTGIMVQAETDSFANDPYSGLSVAGSGVAWQSGGGVGKPDRGVWTGEWRSAAGVTNDIYMFYSTTQPLPTTVPSNLNGTGPHYNMLKCHSTNATVVGGGVSSTGVTTSSGDLRAEIVQWLLFQGTGVDSLRFTRHQFLWGRN